MDGFITPLREKEVIDSVSILTSSVKIKDISCEILGYLKGKDLEPENSSLVLNKGFEVIDFKILSISNLDDEEDFIDLVVK